MNNLTRREFGGLLYAAGFDPVSFIHEHHDRTVSIHVKDRDREHTNRRFGQGATPIAEAMKALKQVKYRYAANIEYEEEAKNPTEGVRQAYDYLKRALA